MAPSTPPPPPLLLLILPLLFALLIFFSSNSATATTTTTVHNRVTTYPSFQHLNVKRAIKQTRITTGHKRHRRQPKSSSSKSQRGEADDESFSLSVNHEDDNRNHTHNHNHNHDHLQFSLKLNLIHRDDLPSSSTSTHSNHTARLTHRLRRDSARLAALTRRLSSETQPLYSTSEFSSDVISGMDEGSGEYFVRVGVGSPPRPQYMVIDTGSDVVWVQCQPCSLCYRQSDPVFDPSDSASFSAVSCRSLLCSRVENSGCTSSARRQQEQYCSYSVLYSDGSYTKGTLALETLTVGSTRIRNLAIGCGHRNTGMFVGAAGLMGLGGGSMSMVGQLGGQTGGAFSYCLVSRGGGGGGGYSSGSGSGSGTGTLVFGRESLPVGAAWVNLVRNPVAPSFYYVGMSGLGVGGVRVAVAESVFEMSEATGEGGVVMDTGTAVTRLPEEAYVALRDAFREQTGSLPRKGGAVSIFDTCYDLAGFVAVRVPTVSFYFRDGPVLTLPARNFLIPVDEAGTFCFAFAPSGSGLSVIGNIQQEGIQISIDGANGFVGFGPNVC